MTEGGDPRESQNVADCQKDLMPRGLKPLAPFPVHWGGQDGGGRIEINQY